MTPRTVRWARHALAWGLVLVLPWLGLGLAQRQALGPLHVHASSAAVPAQAGAAGPGAIPAAGVAERAWAWWWAQVRSQTAMRTAARAAAVARTPVPDDSGLDGRQRQPAAPRALGLAQWDKHPHDHVQPDAQAHGHPHSHPQPHAQPHPHPHPHPHAGTEAGALAAQHHPGVGAQADQHDRVAPDAAPGHRHAAWQRHHHERVDDSVLALDAAPDDAGASTTVSLLLLVLGAPASSLRLNPAPAQPAAWPRATELAFSSWSPSPPLRPPRG